MKVRLGYIASPLTLAPLTYAHTITYTRYQKLEEEKRNIVLDQLLQQNLALFEQVLHYNCCNQVYFYRFSHNLVPLATHPNVHFDFVHPYLDKWKKLGNIVKKHHIRLDTHPSQFCILNSLREQVVDASIKDLMFHYQLFQAMGLPAKVVLHIGGSFGDKEAAKRRFIQNFLQLPLYLQDMIMLENDDKIFTFEDTLEVATILHIPMVLDYHHYLCHHEQKLTKEYLLAIFKTWDKQPYPPKIHFSSPKSKKEFRHHSEYIDAEKFFDFLLFLKEVNMDVDIMLECKARDIALFQLVRQLKCKKKLIFINDTVFLIP